MLDFYKRVCASTYVPHTPIYVIDKLHYDDTNIKRGFVGGLTLPDNSVFDMSLGYQDNFATEYLGPDTGITNPMELFDMSLGYQDNFATEFVDKRLLSYSPTFVYHTNANGNVIVENKGTAGTANDLIFYGGRALQLGATNDLSIPTFANGHLTYFDFATSEFVQVATDGTDHTFNSQTISNIFVHHTPFPANDLAALNVNPNLMAKLAMDGSSILELTIGLQGDEQWYPCTEDSGAGVLSKVLSPVPGHTIFTTSNANTDITFRAPTGEGLYVNGTYYDGQDATNVAVTATGNTIELVESTSGVLTKIVASSQGLNGTVPDLSSNQQLAIVNLSSNNLSGPLPDLSSNPQLTEVYFNKNNLSGPIPDLSANQQLKVITLGVNNLSGPVPDLSANPQLIAVYFNNNNFTDFAGGTITVSDLFAAHNNALTISAVDAILQALVDGGTTGSVTITLQGGTNGVPTNTAAIDTLRSRGCTVTVDGGY